MMADLTIIEEQFRVVVLAIPEVAAFIGDRLRPVFLRPKTPMPAGTYRRVSTRYDQGLDDDDDVEYPTLEITLWGVDYLALKIVSEAFKRRVRASVLFAFQWNAAILDEEDVYDNEFQHPDGIGIIGVRLECRFTKLQ